MTLELVAGRLVARFLGQSLYTWTSILGVMLGGLALGNCLGGRLADRHGWARLIPALLALAAGACVVVLPLNAAAGRLTDRTVLPWPAHIALHVALVFGLPSMALGTISPPLARLALGGAARQGLAFGRVYAWGIVGSVAGTLFTGFVLIGAMGVRGIVLATAGLLAALALIVRLAAVRLGERGGEGHGSAEPATERGAAPELARSVMTAVMAGLAVMLMELAAGRMMAREFGHSIYSWAGVIAVFLGAMSLGTWAGGRLSASRNWRAWLDVWPVPAALGCLAVPLLDGAAGGWEPLWELYWPWRIAAHATLAFALPAAVLGAAVPMAAADALRMPGASGRRAGAIYAGVSAGSVVGTFLGGFWLIDRLGVRGTVLAAAAALPLAGLGLRGARRYAMPALASIALLAAAAWGPWPALRPLALPAGILEREDPFTVYRDESAYYSIRVQADSYDSPVRRMYLDSLKHSEVNLRRPLELRYQYKRLYAAVMEERSPAPAAVRALVIGGGGFTFPRYLELTRPDSEITVVEIDPAVITAAFRAFGLPRDTRIRTFGMDAGIFVRRAGAEGPGGGEYDFIFGDCFNDYVVPHHLVTREFCGAVRQRLKPDGVYLLTIIDVLDRGRFLRAVVDTCRTVFPSVEVLSTHGCGNARDTFVVVCSERPLPLAARCARLAGEWEFAGGLVSPERLRPAERRLVLTDDYAPVENLLADVVRQNRIENAEAIFRKAVRHHEAGDLEAAVEACRVAIRARPGFLAAYDLLGICLGKQGRLQEAIAEWRTAAQLRPDAPNIRDNIGYAYFKMGRLENAVIEWEEALRIDPAYTNAARNLAVARELLRASASLPASGRPPE